MNELPPPPLSQRGGDKLAQTGSPPSLFKLAPAASICEVNGGGSGVRGSSEQGSMLMEALVAVVILAVGLTAVVQALVSAYLASRTSGRYSEAALALENAVVEKIYQGGIAAGVDEEGRMEKPFDRYRYKLASQPLNFNGASNDQINDVAVSVAWDEGAKIKTLSLQTFLFNTSAKSSNENSEF